MLKAKDLMEKNVITVKPDTKITTAISLLLENHINGVPVVDDAGKLQGILCQSDLVFQQKKLPLPFIITILDSIIPLASSRKLEKEVQKISASSVADAMVKETETVTPETPISEVAELMVGKKYHTIPVLDGEKVVGIIGKEDILKPLIQKNTE